MLDLTFFATGYRQHTFIKTSEEAGEWVYKIPAAFGYVLPYRHRLGELRSGTSVKQALHYALVVFPYLLRTRILARLLAPMYAHRSGRRRAFLAPFQQAARGVRAVRNQIFMAYLVRKRARDFEAMLTLLDALEREGLGDLVLPHQILRNSEALLRVDGAALPYRGPILVQKRVAWVFDRETLTAASLHSFDWHEFVTAQRRLWCHGFALSERGENLGYRSWALAAGRLCLADTSSLTRSLRRARRGLHPPSLDYQQQLMLSLLRDGETIGTVEEYFRFVRPAITQECLTRLWCTSLGSASAPSA